MYVKIHCIGRLQFLNTSGWHLVNCASVCVISNYAVSCLDHIAPMVNEWKTSMKHWWNYTGRGKRKYSEKNQSSCGFGQQKSHMDFFRDWTWATVIRDRRLTAWTMPRPRKYGLRNGSVGYLPPFHHRGTGFDLARPCGLGICGRQSGTETDSSPNTSLLADSIIPPMLYIHRSITDPTWVTDSDVEYIEKKRGLLVSGLPAFCIATAMCSTGWYIYN
jgi:hypothetical protein